MGGTERDFRGLSLLPRLSLWPLKPDRADKQPALGGWLSRRPENKKQVSKTFISGHSMGLITSSSTILNYLSTVTLVFVLL